MIQTLALQPRKPRTVVSSNTVEYGEGGPIEFELLTMAREYGISWGKDVADLTELAKLRWERKWSIKRIAVHLGLSYNVVKLRLRKLKARGRTYEALEPKIRRLVQK